MLDNPDVQKAMEMYKDATELESKSKDLKAQAKLILIPMFIAHNEKKIIHPRLGAFKYIPESKTSRLNKDILKAELLTHGIPADTIKKCFDNATQQAPKSASIRLQP